MMKQCTNCGRVHSPQDNFCPVCGCPYFVWVQPLPPPKPLSRRMQKVDTFLKAMIFPLIFLASQVAVGIVIGVICGAYIGAVGAGGSGEPGSIIEQSLSAEFLSLAANVVFLTTIFIIMMKKRRQPIVDLRIKKTKPRFIISSVFIGMSSNVVLSFLVSVIPWPNWMQSSFEESYGDVGSAPFILSVISICIVTGIAEELLFRGALCGRLKKSFGTAASVGISAFVFGLFHGTPIAICYTIVFGILMGAMSEKCGSIIPAMIAHMFFNFTSLLLQYAESVVLMLAIIILSVAVLAAFMWIFFMRECETEDEAAVLEAVE